MILFTQWSSFPCEKLVHVDDYEDIILTFLDVECTFALFSERRSNHILCIDNHALEVS